MTGNTDERLWLLALQDADRRLAVLHQELSALEKERRAAAALIGSGVLANYERVRKSQAPPWIVLLARDVCMQCHLRVPPQLVSELRGGNAVAANCPHCGRMLMWALSDE